MAGQFEKQQQSTQLPEVPAFALLDIYPRGMNTCVHTETYTQIFIAASLVMAKKRKQPRWSFNRWMVKQTTVQPCHGILVSKKKGNELLLQRTW